VSEKKRRIKLKGKNALSLRRAVRDTDTLWTTPWEWRDEEDAYVGHNGQMWLYRAMPVEPLEWEDPGTRIAVGQNLATMLAEIGSTAAAPIGALKSLSNNREIHVVSVTWDGPVRPPAGNGASLANFQSSMLDFTAPKKALLIGVRLRTSIATAHTNVLDQALNVAAKILAEDVPDRAAYEKDRVMIAGICARYGGRVMTAEERAHLESWYNNGRGTDTLVVENTTTVRVPAYDTFEISALMRFQNSKMFAPNAQWALDAASHPHGPKLVSIRAELEHTSVTRARARRSQRRVEATMKEEAATGDLERPEYAAAFQQAQDFENFLVESSEPILTNCSILLARPVREADETYIDFLRNSYGIEVKPLEHRQIRALDETLPCSSRRVNPFLQDVSIAMVAFAGLNGFSNLGDREGLYTAVAVPDYTPVFLDPGAAAKENKPAAMLVAGDSGSGKSFLCQMLAVQATVDGKACIFINPKGHDSLEAMAKLVDGQVVKMSALEERPGAFDPFRYAPPLVAAEIATNHILGVLGGEGGFTQAQQLELGSALKQAAQSGAKCVADAFPFMRDQNMVLQIRQQVEGSSLFALGVGLEPLTPFGAQSGLMLIEFDRKPELPDPSKPANVHTRPERIALAAIRLVTRASLEILMLSHGGVLVVDEAWTFLGYSEGLAALTQLGREGRSLNILPIFATQRVADVVSRDMESYLSRVFCLRLSDERDAKVALELCGLEPSLSRINWLKNCGPRAATTESPARPAMALHRDLRDRHSAVMIWPVPEEMRRAISTNPLDREKREEDADGPGTGGVEGESANG
jgi:hypothetical protein